MDSLKHSSQEITRVLMRRIEALPAPVKTLIGLLPGGGMVTTVAEHHKWSLLRAAHHLAREGKLSPAVKVALREHDLASTAEARAYDRLIRLLEREL